MELVVFIVLNIFMLTFLILAFKQREPIHAYVSSFLSLVLALVLMASPITAMSSTPAIPYTSNDSCTYGVNQTLVYNQTCTFSYSTLNSDVEATDLMPMGMIKAGLIFLYSCLFIFTAYGGLMVTL